MTFNWYQSLISLLGLIAWRKDDVAFFITIPSVEVPHFDGNYFVPWKSQMSTYLHEMNPQVWWMIDVGLSYALKDCPQTQV
jgi:hypothetical protein